MGEIFGMDGGGEGAQAAEERGRGGVKEFVANAIDAALLDRRHVVPGALKDDFFEWNAVAGAAPGGDDDVGGFGENRFGGSRFAGRSDELAACGVDQLGDPGLGCDQRLTPFFAENARAGFGGGRLADEIDFTLHIGDDAFASFGGGHDSGDGGDVGVDVGEGAGGEAEETGSGFQNLGDGFFLVRNGGEDEVGAGGDDLGGVGGPGVGDDGDIAVENFRAHVSAIFGAGYEAIEPAESGKDHGGAGLQRNNAAGSVIGRHRDNVTGSGGRGARYNS